MSRKILDLLKIATALTKKVDEHLDKMVKVATNVHSHLEYGSEGAIALYQTILAMQKKGSKGDKLSDYKSPNIPKFVKEIEAAKGKLEAEIKTYNAMHVQVGQFIKMMHQVDVQVIGLARDKDIAKNPAAIKLLMEVRKQVVDMEKMIEAADVAPKGDLGRFIALSPSMKVEDLTRKLPMAFKSALSDWQNAGSKLNTAARGFRKNNLASAMKAAETLV